MKQCEIEGCEKRHYARGWCSMHYRRWIRTGDPVRKRQKNVRNKEHLNYRSMHKRLDVRYGKAKVHDCSNCFGPAQEWAFIHEWCPKEELIETINPGYSGEPRTIYYSMNDGHYLTLCKKCHTAMDKGEVYHDEHS